MKTPSPSVDIAATTLGYYERNADSFWEGTKDHDVSQNYAALLSAISGAGPFRILDLGCGPGRDVLHFKTLGHEAVGLDGSARFCEMARRHTGCEILHQNFLDLNLKEADFHGIFANATLFHVPKTEIARVLLELHRALKPGGILFSSNPRGTGEDCYGDRYGAYYEFADYAPLLERAGFEVLHHYYRPTGKPRAEQPWLAVVSRKKS